MEIRLTVEHEGNSIPGDECAFVRNCSPGQKQREMYTCTYYMYNFICMMENVHFDEMYENARNTVRIYKI